MLVYEHFWKFSWEVSCVHAKLLQSCLTLLSPVDCSLPGSSVYEYCPGKKIDPDDESCAFKGGRWKTAVQFSHRGQLQIQAARAGDLEQDRFKSLA